MCQYPLSPNIPLMAKHFKLWCHYIAPKHVRTFYWKIWTIFCWESTLKLPFVLHILFSYQVFLLWLIDHEVFLHRIMLHTFYNNLAYYIHNFYVCQFSNISHLGNCAVTFQYIVQNQQLFLTKAILLISNVSSML